MKKRGKVVLENENNLIPSSESEYNVLVFLSNRLYFLEVLYLQKNETYSKNSQVTPPTHIQSPLLSIAYFSIVPLL